MYWSLILIWTVITIREIQTLDKKKVYHKNTEAIQTVKPMHMQTICQLLEGDWQPEV